MQIWTNWNEKHECKRRHGPILCKLVNSIKSNYHTALFTPQKLKIEV